MHTRPKNLTIPLALAVTGLLVLLWVIGTLDAGASSEEPQAVAPSAPPEVTGPTTQGDAPASWARADSEMQLAGPHHGAVAAA